MEYSKSSIYSLAIYDADQDLYLQKMQIEFPNNSNLQNQISTFVENSYIETTFGRVYLDQPPDNHGLRKVEHARWKVYKDWLYHDGQRQLWLPPDFRPICAARYDDLFVMGHGSDKVTFFASNDNDSVPERSLSDHHPGN